MGNDATQKLVDELHGVVVAFGDMSPIGNLCRRAARALTEAADALEAAQRPPVSPEQREAVRMVVGEQLTKAGLDLNGAPYSDDGETQWPLALELRDRMTDALLARFTIPVLDTDDLRAEK